MPASRCSRTSGRSPSPTTRPTTIAARSEAAVTAYLAMQMALSVGYTDTDARCFAPQRDRARRDFGYNGLQPVDERDPRGRARRVRAPRRRARARPQVGARARAPGQDDRAARVATRPASRSTGWASAPPGRGRRVRRALGRDRRTSSRWLELRRQATTRRSSTAADQLIAGLKSKGVAGQIRSFNWQCRSAVMTPALLK